MNRKHFWGRARRARGIRSGIPESDQPIEPEPRAAKAWCRWERWKKEVTFSFYTIGHLEHNVNVKYASSVMDVS